MDDREARIRREARRDEIIARLCDRSVPDEERVRLKQLLHAFSYNMGTSKFTKHD